MKDSLEIFTKELLNSINIIQALIETNLKFKSEKELINISEWNLGAYNDFNYKSFKNEVDEIIEILREIRDDLNKNEFKNSDDLITKLDKISEKLPKTFDQYSGYRVFFYPFIYINYMVRVLLRIIDIINTAGNTWNKTSKTPLANEIFGTNQFFSLSPYDEIKLATKQFQEAKLQFELAVSTVNKLPEACPLIPTAPDAESNKI